MVWRHIKEFGDFRSSWLHLAQFIRAARLQYTLLFFPFPIHAKPGVRHRIYRAENLSLFPGLAAVSGYFHLTDLPPAGPSQASDLVVSRTGQLLSSRRKGDD